MEKIKITKKEIKDLYDVIDEDPVSSTEEHIQGEDKNFTFEEYTESYDKQQLKEFKEDAS